jgi:hypothetical protein
MPGSSQKLSLLWGFYLHFPISCAGQKVHSNVLACNPMSLSNPFVASGKERYSLIANKHEYIDDKTKFNGSAATDS